MLIALDKLLRLLDLELAPARAACLLAGLPELPAERTGVIGIGPALCLAVWNLLHRFGLPAESQYAILKRTAADLCQYAEVACEGTLTGQYLSLELLDNQYVGLTAWPRLYDFKNLTSVDQVEAPVVAVSIAIPGLMKRVLVPCLAEVLTP